VSFWRPFQTASDDFVGLEWALGGDLTSDWCIEPRLQDPPYYTQFPNNKGLFYDWLKHGTFIDHLTGCPGLGERLAGVAPHERLTAVRAHHMPCFVQQDTASLPPAAIIHGALDSLVPVEQSFAIAQELAQLDKEYRLEVCCGGVYGTHTALMSLRRS
jgi:hypothetical protein